MSSNLGDTLKNLRVNAGLSQKEVAEILGYDTAQFVSNWERNISIPPAGSTDKLAKLYSVQKEQLVEAIISNYILDCEAKMRVKYYGKVSKKR